MKIHRGSGAADGFSDKKRQKREAKKNGITGKEKSPADPHG